MDADPLDAAAGTAGGDEVSDVIERLRKWANVVPVPPAAEAMQDAADEITRLRGALMELGACVRTSESLDEAIGHANRWSPMNVHSVAIQGFHMVDMAWRAPPEVT